MAKDDNYVEIFFFKSTDIFRLKFQIIENFAVDLKAIEIFSIKVLKHEFLKP